MVLAASARIRTFLWCPEATDLQIILSAPTWLTSVRALDKTEATLLEALRSGRAWCAWMVGYQGALDLLVDGICPMGSVSVSELPTTSLVLTATDIPNGGTLELVQGLVDYAGTADPTPPATRVVATFPGTALNSGSAELLVDTRQSSFVRSQVRDSAGALVALSNPVWLLRETPPSAIPAERGC